MTEKRRQVMALALGLMGQWGLGGWEFGFNRLRRTTGRCVFPHGGRPGRIEVSVHFVDLNPPEKIRDTLLHEIAHALAGPDAYHGPVWRSWCQTVGANPDRHCRDAIMPQGKWAAACGGCGFEHNRIRKPRAQAYRCNFCSGLVAYARRSE